MTTNREDQVERRIVISFGRQYVYLACTTPPTT